MKKAMIIGFMFMIALSCKAQIVPVENAVVYRDAGEGIPNGVYLKDVNNLFDNYIGTWKGTYNNISYRFEIKKIVESSNGLTEDKLLIRYLITKADGSATNVTLGMPDNMVTIVGDYFSKDKSSYVLNYYPRNGNCSAPGVVYIAKTKASNFTQMSLKFFSDNSAFFNENCPGKVMSEPILPYTGYVILTKQ